jgi:very-short-patch-repair endonuclease
MIYIVTDNQMDRLFPNKLVPEEDIEFVRRYKQEKNHYPRFRDLQQSSERVGDIYPEHSKKDIKLKTYVDLYLGKFRKNIISKLSKESGDNYVESKRGKKMYVTMDGKTILRSVLESLTYSVFLLEGVIDEIEIDTKKFSKICHKEPDFLWERKKLIIEVAGMEGEDYHKKLEMGSKCLENLGYKVIVIDARKFEKSNKYLEYYLHLCNLLGFKPRQEVIESPYKFLGYADITKQMIQKYIDDNINDLPLTRKQDDTLSKYLNQLYGYGIKEYKKRMGLTRFRHSVKKDEIINFKSKNPKMSNKEIADYFNVGKNTVQTATKGMEGLKN